MRYLTLILGFISVAAFAQQPPQPPIPQNNGFTQIPVVYGGIYLTSVFTVWYNTELSNTPMLTFKQTLPSGKIYIKVGASEGVLLEGISSVSYPLAGDSINPHFVDVWVHGGKAASHLEITSNETKAKRKVFEFDIPPSREIFTTANFIIAKEDCGQNNCDIFSH